MSIPISDLALGLFIVLAVGLGGWAGAINVIGKLGSLFVGYIAARAWSGWLAALIQGWLLATVNVDSQAGDLTARLLSLITFVIIFIVVSWLVRLVATALSGLLGGGLLGSVNHGLGALVAGLLAVGLILLCSEIFVPAAAEMGLPAGPQQFFADSQYILPLLRRWLLIQTVV